MKYVHRDYVVFIKILIKLKQILQYINKKIPIE